MFPGCSVLEIQCIEVMVGIARSRNGEMLLTLGACWLRLEWINIWTKTQPGRQTGAKIITSKKINSRTCRYQPQEKSQLSSLVDHNLHSNLDFWENISDTCCVKSDKTITVTIETEWSQ